MPALAVIPFVLILPTLLSIPNLPDLQFQDELNVDNSRLSNDVGPALFQRKLIGIPTPLYAELSQGIMSYKVTLFHEYKGKKYYYYMSSCKKDLMITTNNQLATVFEIQTGEEYIQKGGKFTIGCYCSNSTNSEEGSGEIPAGSDQKILQWLGVRKDATGMYLTADHSSNGFKFAAGQITPYYMKNIV